MKQLTRILAVLTVLVLLTAEAPARPTAKEALQGLQDLIGSWKGTGMPNGTREEKDKGFWLETIDWQWQFKDKDVWLRGDIEKGKYYSRFDLRYLADKELYELKATTLGK